MKKLKQSIGNLKRREKTLVFAAIIVCAVLLINKVLIVPAFKSLNAVSEKYEAKDLLLKKYYDFMSNEEWYAKKLKSLEDEYKILEGRILKYGTEELASAKLQELAKNIARRNGLSISRSIAAKKRIITDEPYLVAISANFEINEINQVEKLKSFLYDLEYNEEKLYFVNDIKIKGIGVDKIQGISVSTTLAVIASIGNK